MTSRKFGLFLGFSKPPPPPSHTLRLRTYFTKRLSPLFTGRRYEWSLTLMLNLMRNQDRCCMIRGIESERHCRTEKLQAVLQQHLKYLTKIINVP